MIVLIPPVAYIEFDAYDTPTVYPASGSRAVMYLNVVSVFSVTTFVPITGSFIVVK